MKIKEYKPETGVFRAITISASGFGAAMLAVWALNLVGISPSTYEDAAVFGAAVLGLAALAGAGTAHAYFAGGDDTSEAYEALLGTDAVTELLSRRGLAEALKTFISEGNQPSRINRTFLISLDFDTLREFNESFGVETGDALLRVFAERLRRIVGETGLLARTSGGEFIVVIRANHDDRELRAAVDALLGVMSLPVRIGKASRTVFWNAGVVEVHDERTPLDRILRHANLARATALAASRGTWSIYHPEMSQVAAYRQWIEVELYGALKRDELHLYYQAKVDASTGKTIGYEALLRWQHHEKGSIPPSEFIPVAEQCGLIQPVGDFVLRQVCEDLRHLPEHLTVSANVSPAQLTRPDFLTRLSRLLAETEVQQGRLEIELTETMLIKNHVEMRRLLNGLRDIGVPLAIDDFGTGYSNLSNLSEFKFHALKIDKSFVDRLEDGEASAAAMVASIVGMARSIDAEIVAEGVETVEQITLLQAAGCNTMQGYYYGRPMPLTAILRQSEERTVMGTSVIRPADTFPAGVSGSSIAPKRVA